MDAQAGLQFEPAELMAVRLLELHLVSSNAVRAGGELTHAAKIADSVRTMAKATDRFDVVTALASDNRTVDKSLTALERLAPDVREAMLPFVGLESYSIATPGQGKKWVIDRETVLLAALGRMGDGAEELRATLSAYNKAVKRLASASISPALRLALLGGTVALTMASGGLATAAGTFIGSTFMGLSGAAATSAGLAFLGGGSLAAGGFGMAGGTILVGAAAKTGYAGARTLALAMARQSAAATMMELAKLDATTTAFPEMVPAALKALRELDAALETEPRSKDVRKSQRAVKAEIRHLTDTGSQRIARTASKFVPLPGLDRLIDRMS